MSDLKDYLTAQEAAEIIDITYHLFMARVRKGLIKIEKKGWATLVHKDEVEKARKYQEQLKSNKDK